jgi:hypothetical protein
MFPGFDGVHRVELQTRMSYIDECSTVGGLHDTLIIE